MVSSSPGGRARVRFRTVFLSDVHLGSPRAQAELLLDFLAHHQSELLYLVGDIVDDGRAFASERWPAAHRAVLDAVRAKASEGTRVFYLPGNHDLGSVERWHRESQVEIVREIEHTTADGRRLLVLHGDGFDAIVGRRRWLSALGDALTRALEGLCDALEALCRRRRARLALALRERCKRWLGYTARFERSAVFAARARAVDGIICGHVHSAASRTIDGVYYGNGGDWVGSATALVEHTDGRLELLSWERVA